MLPPWKHLNRPQYTVIVSLSFSAHCNKQIWLTYFLAQWFSLKNISIIGVAILRGSCYSKAGGHLLCSIYFYIVKFFGALIFSLSRAPFLGNILSKHMIDGAWHNGLVAKVIALNAPGSNMGASSSPGSLLSHPIPSFWPGKAVKDSLKPWDSAPEWKTQKNSWLLASYWSTSGHCGHLGSKISDGRSTSLSLLSVYLTLQ